MSAEANDKKRFIRIRGANENNLKNLSVDIPRDQFVVLTGLSGSGKSSLAFDTIYAEGQRRYMESLSSYARQFLGQMEKPDVESIEGLPPAISIDQKSTNRNPRSTVGTVTEIYDYFRLLYARVGIPHCPKCGREIRKQTVDQMVDQIMTLPERQKIQLLAPVVRGRKGTHVKLLDQARRSGYVRVQIDGNLYELSEEIKLDKNIKHNIEIVVDRLIVKPGIEKRLSDSIETVLDLADGLLVVDTMDGKLLNFSQSFSCPDCGISIDEIEPRSFSFNNPFGACPQCLGLGYKMEFDIDLMIPDKKRSINEGAIAVLGWQSCTTQGSFSRAILDALAREYEFSLDTPFCEYPKKVQDILIHGTGGHSVKVYYKGQRGEGVYDVAFPGLIRNVEQRYRETGSEAMKQEYESFMRITPCTTCKGQRLKKESLAVTVADKNIYEVTNMPVQKLQGFFRDLKLSKQQELIGRQILKEIRARVGFLAEVGLEYLSLGRATGTLSGGEAQRIRLATQIGSGLVGVAYILDEPSIGLHQRDNDKLLGALMRLRDLGNSLIVVEHDEDTMRAADCVIDIGPGAGEHGGQLVAMGTAEDLMKNEQSVTGAYLSGRLKIPVPEVRKEPTGFLHIKGAAENNLKHIDVDIPLGVMTCITGVSGSGKSSLINEILYKRLARDLNRARVIPGKHDDILGIDQLDKVINIDQSPIGRTPRSNPATYTGVFDQIRDLFAATADAKAKGYEVTCNIMAISNAKESDIDQALEMLGQSSADGIYIVDSYGALYPEQIRAIADKYTALGEKYGKYIGMHAHNNQQLAFANTIEALSHGVSLLDATMMSMGRGAGNCAMELLLSFLKNPKYNVFPVLRFLEDYMLPLKETGAVWGYDIPYLLTGRLNQHPSAAIDFCKDNRKDYADFYTDLLDK